MVLGICGENWATFSEEICHGCHQVQPQTRDSDAALSKPSYRFYRLNRCLTPPRLPSWQATGVKCFLLRKCQKVIGLSFTRSVLVFFSRSSIIILIFRNYLLLWTSTPARSVHHRDDERPRKSPNCHRRSCHDVTELALDFTTLTSRAGAVILKKPIQPLQFYKPWAGRTPQQIMQKTSLS